MADYLTLDDVKTAGRRVLVRADLNVPLDGGEVADDFRLRASLGWWRNCVRRARRWWYAATWAARRARFRLQPCPCGAPLGGTGGFPVRHLPALVGREVTEAVGGAQPGDVLLLENTRFHPGETSNDPALAARLAELADLFCQDAFGSVHRVHASTVGVAACVRSVAGPLLSKNSKPWEN